MNQFDVHRGENPRIIPLFWIVLLAGAILVGGLAWRQLFAQSEYIEIEKRQTERRILKPGPRGDIYDRNGRLLVGNRPSYSAVVYLDDLRPEFRREFVVVRNAADAALLAEWEAAADEGERPADPPIADRNELQWLARQNVIDRYVATINRISGRTDEVSRSRIIRHFNERLLLPLPLVEDLTPDQYARLVEQMPVQSPIQIQTDTARYYPYGEAAAHTLGYVQSTDPDPAEVPDDGVKTFTFQTKVGKTGLEKFFDAQLSGTTGMEIWRVDPLGFQDTRLEMEPPRQGADLITSIDIDLQLTAELSLGERTGAVVVMDVRSGEVLAIVSHPTYDLNDLSPFIPRTTFDAINERGAWLNRALQLSYPPGSTFKLITSIAGLRAGLIDASTVHECRGIYRVGDRVFRCHARQGHGDVDLAAAIEGSCNVFYYAEGLEMGIAAISAEARRFGLDEKTGIEIPFETGRLVVPDRAWKRERGLGGWVPGDTANTSIGQGFLLVTPLQMAATMASIARGETRTQPTLRALTEAEGLLVDHGGEPIGLNEQQRSLLFRGMEQVVGPDGTGRLIQIDGLRIGGKTGTADFRAHGKDVNLAWFTGFAPVEDPQIAVAVMVEGTSESDSFHGGSTAGPIARDIFQTFLEKYLVQADI